MLAHHYLSAIDLARAAGLPLDATPRAAAAAREAGDRAYRLSAYASSATYYEASAVLLPEDDPTRAGLELQRGVALWHAGDERARSVLEGARNALITRGMASRAGEAEAVLAEVCWMHEEGEAALDHLCSAGTLVDADPERAWWLKGAAMAAHAAQQQPAVARAVRRGPAGNRWRTVCELILGGRWEDAADGLAGLEQHFDASVARLHAAEAFRARGQAAAAREQAQRALSFFTEANASRYVRQAAALLG